MTAPEATAPRRAATARGRSLADAIGGSSSSRGRSRTGGASRSRHSRRAVVSPARASSTAFLVRSSASPCRRTSTAWVARQRAPRGRPYGFPLSPLFHLPACFRSVLSGIGVLLGADRAVHRLHPYVSGSGSTISCLIRIRFLALSHPSGLGLSSGPNQTKGGWLLGFKKRFSRPSSLRRILFLMLHLLGGVSASDQGPQRCLPTCPPPLFQWFRHLQVENHPQNPQNSRVCPSQIEF